MYFFLFAFLIAMISYLLHEMSLVKVKKQFNEIIKNLEEEKTEILREMEGLKAKDKFYSHLSMQLERKNEEILSLSNEVKRLKTEIKLKQN